MSARVFAALVTAASVIVLVLASIVTSQVVGVVASQSRYPEAMFEYALPALGAALRMWPVPLVAMGVVVFVCFAFVLSIKNGDRVRGVVAKAFATSVLATLAVAAVLAAQIVIDNPQLDLSRELAFMLVSSATIVSDAFLAGCPLIVLAGVLVWVWHRRDGLTEVAEVE